MSFPLKIAPLHGRSRLHLIHGSLGPLESSTQTSWSVQPFLHSSRQSVPILYNGALSPQHCPFPWGIWHPSNTWFRGPVRAYNPYDSSIGSAIYAQLTVECPYTLQWVAPSPPQNCPFPWGYSSQSNMISWAHLSPQPKLYLDWFSRLSRAHDCDRQTDRRTTLLRL